MPAKAAQAARRERVLGVARQAEGARRRKVMAAWGIGLVLVIAVVTAMLLTARPQSSQATAAAPGFTLTDTSGKSVSLSQFRGHNVVLYFNEGAGCQSCLVQMREIEKQAPALAKLDVTVLPIVMNGREQILADMRRNNVSTPFLLDDGKVSQSYGTLGKGMHAGLPGHSFVLIDAQGQQRWYGEYPSMWLAPDKLLAEVQNKVGG